LRWSRPEEDVSLANAQIAQDLLPLLTELRGFVDQLRYLKERSAIWQQLRAIRSGVHETIRRHVEKADAMQALTGLALAGYQSAPGVKLDPEGIPRFEVHAFREARRQREDGRVLNQAFVTLLQSHRVEFEGEKFPMRCGSTLVLDLDESRVAYVIRKGPGDIQRMRRTRKFLQDGADSLAATYFGSQDEPFAGLHSPGA
jgi:hypothetical protein